MKGYNEGKVTLAHGEGGLATQRLISGLILKYFDHPALVRLDDAAVLSTEGGGEGCSLAVTTDSFVVKPLFFPGGDIGKLAVCGTVNDLAVCGARPRYLTVGLILEEGFSLEDLERILSSVARTAAEAGVSIVAGDTKVVEKGSADQVFINTTGVGFIPPGTALGYERIRPGDAVVINGGVGEHGLAVLSQREGLSFATPIESDCAPLNGLIQGVLNRFGERIRFMRDVTRGGVATVVQEVAAASGVDFVLEEERLPTSAAVVGACEMLGLDPLYLANEGKVLMVVDPSVAGELVAALRGERYGKEGAVIGYTAQTRGKRQGLGGEAFLKTALGATRRLDLLDGELLPRIC